MTPSKYQTTIYDRIRTSWTSMKSGGSPVNLIIDAGPGSGKTHVIREMCSQVPDARIDVVAFNERNAKEAAARLPSNATSCTMHATGKRALERFFGHRFRDENSKVAGDGELAKNKIARILAKLKERGEVDPYIPLRAVGALVNAARSVGLVPRDAMVGRNNPQIIVGSVPDRDDEWLALIERHQIQYAQPGKLISTARNVLRVSVENASAIIDFADMIYIATHLTNITFPTKDIVAVDELQDLDAVQRRMVTRMLGQCPRCRRVGAALIQSCDSIFADTPEGGWRSSDVCAACGGTWRGALFVGVGDPRQACYSWRGADSDSMDKCRQELKCDVLPLPVSYRCPRSHVDAARVHCPTLEAREGAPLGEIKVWGAAPVEIVSLASLNFVNTPITPNDFQPGDAVICRFNAPLVRVAYWLMRSRIPCRVVGRDFGRDLASMLESFKCPTVSAALAILDTKIRRSETKDNEDKTLDGASSEATIRLRDCRDVLEALAEAVLDRAGIVKQNVTIDEVLGEIEHLFGESGSENQVTLLSIHRAKGGEWSRVWWVDEVSPAKRRRSEAPKGWRAKEEANLRFVAMTRSKNSLFVLSPENFV